MKTPLAVTLIIMGALLIMTPAVSDCLYQRNLVELLSRPGVVRADLAGSMPDLYRIGCWITGSVMVGIAVMCSLVVSNAEPARERLAAKAV